jgi:hypothetical protein
MHIKQRTILKALMWMWVSIGGVSTTDGDIDNGGPRVVVRIKGSIDDCVTGVTASETPPAASTGVTGLNLDGVASTLSVAECVATRYHTGESWPPYPSFSMNTSYAECISRRQHSLFDRDFIPDTTKIGHEIAIPRSNSTSAQRRLSIPNEM